MVPQPLLRAVAPLPGFPASDGEDLLTRHVHSVRFAGVSLRVEPGMRVITTGRVVFFRRRKLRCAVEMKREDGTLVCSGTLSGMGVPK